jgi:hypothetical protein
MRLGRQEVVITELQLQGMELACSPSDGGLNVLTDFFARSDTTLTKVRFWDCYNVGSQQDASQLIAAFATNRTITDLSTNRIGYLRDAVLGNTLSDLVQSIPQLQRLGCCGCLLLATGVRAFQPGLRVNRTLKELILSDCEIPDEGIHLLAEAMVGNTTMDIVAIDCNYITSAGLDDITRMIESTRLKTLLFDYNNMGNCTDGEILHFLTILCPFVAGTMALL